MDYVIIVQPMFIKNFMLDLKANKLFPSVATHALWIYQASGVRHPQFAPTRKQILLMNVLPQH